MIFKKTKITSRFGSRVFGKFLFFIKSDTK